MHIGLTGDSYLSLGGCWSDCFVCLQAETLPVYHDSVEMENVWSQLYCSLVSHVLLDESLL